MWQRAFMLSRDTWTASNQVIIEVHIFLKQHFVETVNDEKRGSKLSNKTILLLQRGGVRRQVFLTWNYFVCCCGYQNRKCIQQLHISVPFQNCFSSKCSTECFRDLEWSCKMIIIESCLSNLIIRFITWNWLVPKTKLPS